MYSYIDDLCEKLYGQANHHTPEWEKVFIAVFENMTELGIEYWTMETFDLSQYDVFSTPKIYKERIFHLEKSLRRSGESIDNTIGLSNLRTMKQILGQFKLITPLSLYF